MPKWFVDSLLGLRSHSTVRHCVARVNQGTDCIWLKGGTHRRASATWRSASGELQQVISDQHDVGSLTRHVGAGPGALARNQGEGAPLLRLKDVYQPVTVLGVLSAGGVVPP